MNTRQRQAEIEHIAKQVVHRALPNTSELPDGFYVVKVQNGFARHVPFDEVLEAALSRIVGSMMAKEPAVQRQIEEWREYDATIADFLAGTGRK